MKILFILAVLTNSINSGLVTSSRKITSRQFCDSLGCDDWKWLTAPLGAAAEFFNNLPFQLPPQELKPSFNDGSQEPIAPPLKDPEINLDVTGERNRGTDECKVPPASPPDFQTDSEDGVVRQCDQARQYLIWPVNCEDRVQNTNTQNLIGAIDRRFLTSTSPLCAVQGGVLFWLGEFTPEQIAALKNAGGVRAAVPNGPYSFGELDSRPAGTTVPAHQKRKYLEERGTRVSVEKQQNADTALSFLSTPEKKQISGTYTYLQPAGVGIRIFVIETAFDPSGSEFKGLELDWLYSFDVSRIKSDVSEDVVHFGTCTLSKLLGQKFGVAKKALVTVVKTNPTIASFVDALGRIVASLEGMFLAYHNTKGWTVINMAGQFEYDEVMDWTEFGVLISELQYLMAEIETRYQAVMVTSSGTNWKEPYADVNTWPALFSQTNNIIVVGSVLAATMSQDGLENGQVFPWSPGGEGQVTVFAPGNGACVGPGRRILNDARGGNISTAIVSGLVAYFLSLPDLGDYFRQLDNLPEGIAKYLQDLQYKRFASQLSVWNGLDSEDSRDSFPQWMRPTDSMN